MIQFISEDFLRRADHWRGGVVRKKRSADKLLRDRQARIEAEKLRHLGRPLIADGKPEPMSGDITGKVMAMKRQENIFKSWQQRDNRLLVFETAEREGDLCRLCRRQKTEIGRASCRERG